MQLRDGPRLRGPGSLPLPISPAFDFALNVISIIYLRTSFSIAQQGLHFYPLIEYFVDTTFRRN